MKLFHHTSTRVVGLTFLAGLSAAACSPTSSNSATGAGGAVTTGGSNRMGGTTGTSSAQTGGAASGGTKSASGGAASGGAASGGAASGGAASGGSASGGAASGGSASGGAASGGAASGGANVGGSASGGAGAGGSGTGGTTSKTGGTTSAGGASGAGGSSAATCPAATSYPDCSLTTGVVTGNACKPNPVMFALDANCNIGLWASDYTSSGYFYQPWCNSATTSCTLTMACATNSMHIAGSYLGSSTAAPMDGNAGWGANLQTTYPDAGAGCQMIDGTGLTGLTLDINVTTLPTGNHLDIGITLANGNSADYTAVLTTGAQTVKIPWTCFKNKNLCGSVPGPGITNFYYSFDWFNDGATHAVDITLSNIGFY